MVSDHFGKCFSDTQHVGEAQRQLFSQRVWLPVCVDVGWPHKCRQAVV